MKSNFKILRCVSMAIVLHEMITVRFSDMAYVRTHNASPRNLKYIFSNSFYGDLNNFKGLNLTERGEINRLVDDIAIFDFLIGRCQNPKSLLY